MCARIVVAEDDEQQAELVRRYLEAERHSVVIIRDGRDALDEVRRQPPDLLILDIMLPTMSGLDVCRLLREESSVPTLMLTARSTEDDLVIGLDAGADDYVTKPFSPRELMARVRTMLRRTRTEPNDDGLLRVGSLIVDTNRYTVTLDGTPIVCTPGEFRLLHVMAATPERTLTRAQILSGMHGYDRFITQRTIDMHISNLRRKIEPRPGEPVYLLTVYGIGYRLSAGPGAAG